MVRAQLATKRCLDLLLAGAALALWAIPLACLMLAIRLGMGRPVLFRQLRPGKDEKLFAVYKLRTMIDACGADGRPLPDAQRLTPLGRFLRRTSLDELPQLWNVLCGDMSLVGPRPLLERYLPYYSDRERLRFAVRPGITGWAQVHGRNTVGWDERLALDGWYVENWSLALDCRILWQTFLAVLTRRGVVADPQSLGKDLDEARRDSSRHAPHAVRPHAADRNTLA